MASMGNLKIEIIRIANYGGSSTVAFIFLGKVINVIAGPSESMDKFFR